jgi:undecaprenyl-phosphate 4-deoxy-4-formamido-L-arabinose transferase
MTVSVVVPVYDAVQTLEELWLQLSRTLVSLGKEFEVIFVDDASRDSSWSVLTALQAREPTRIHAIRLMRNYGQHNALLCGIRAAKNAVVVTLDDDLQNPPEEIPRLLNKIEAGLDVVYGTPVQGQHGLWRNLASRITKLALQSAMGAEVARQVSAFRAFRTPIRNAFASYQGPFVSIDVLLTWGTTRFGSIPVRLDPRRAGQSGYTVRKLIVHALNMMTGFSVLPLQIASMIGFFFTLFGLGVLAYVIGRFLIQGGGVPGFPFLASIIAIFSGVQLFSLGVIGEYLSRMHFRLMDRPPYTVRDDAGRVSASPSR